MPQFMPISLRIGPLTTTIAAIELVVLPRALTPLAARARITGKYSGRAPAITALTATFSTVNSQCCAKLVRAHVPDDFVRLAARVRQHFRHALFGRQDDRQLVGPIVLQEQADAGSLRYRARPVAASSARTWFP